MFVCLGFFDPLDNFPIITDVTVIGEGLQIFYYARHSGPLNRQGSLTCHNYSDTGQPFIRPSLRTHDTYNCCRAFVVELSLTFFKGFGQSRSGLTYAKQHLKTNFYCVCIIFRCVKQLTIKQSFKQKKTDFTHAYLGTQFPLAWS